MWLGIRLLFLRAISPDSRTHDARQNLMDDQYLPVDSRSDNDHCSMKGLTSLADQELVLQLVGLPQFSQHLDRSMQCSADDDDELSKVRQDPQQQQRDWSSTASLGEKQRIAVARVLLHHPKLVTYSRTTYTTSRCDIYSQPLVPRCYTFCAWAMHRLYWMRSAAAWTTPLSALCMRASCLDVPRSSLSVSRLLIYNSIYYCY